MKIHTTHYLWPDGKTIGCIAWTKNPFNCRRFTVDSSEIQSMYPEKTLSKAIIAYSKKCFQEINNILKKNE